MVERIPSVERNYVGAAEITGQEPRLPAGIPKVFPVCLGEFDLLAARLQGELHLGAVYPAFLAIWGTDFEPVRLSHEDIDRFATVHYMESGIAAARPGSQFQIGIGHRHGSVFIGGLGKPGGKSLAQYENQSCQPNRLS